MQCQEQSQVSVTGGGHELFRKEKGSLDFLPCHLPLALAPVVVPGQEWGWQICGWRREGEHGEVTTGVTRNSCV